MGLIYITGPSGCGKTRMILEMLGYIEPQESEMKLIYDGDKNDIAWMPQNPVWFKGTLWENLCPVEMRSLEDVKCALQRVNLGHFEQRLGESPHNFSGGEKRRLAIARIILLSRGVWILDEPFAGLDKVNVEVIERLLKEESKVREIFCITHHAGNPSSGRIRMEFC